MNLTARYVFMIFLTTLVSLLPGPLTMDSPAAGRESKRVFVLSSLNRGFTGTDNMLHGIDDALPDRRYQKEMLPIIGAFILLFGILVYLLLEVKRRKKIEETLRISEEKNRALFEDVPIETLVIDREGRIIQYNKAFERSAEKRGRRLPEIGNRMYVDYASRHSTDMRSELMNSMNSKTAKTFNEMPYRNRFLNIHIAPTREGAIISTIDVTERKQAEEELARAAREWQSTFDATNDAIWILDRDQRVLRSNKTAERFFHRSCEEIVGKHCFEIVHGTKQPIPECPLLRAQKSLHRETMELPVGEHWFEIFVDPVLDAAGRYSGAVHIVSDITERKRAEEDRRSLQERLRHADKMEAIGTLAGGIAHDFNNLLMGIQGYASLMLLNLDPSHPHYEGLKRIEEQVQSGADLAKRLLGFASGGRYEVKPADMNDILEKSSSMFGRTKKEITIHRKYAKDLWSVEADLGQMEQVFMNLYVNAWQAMPGGGEIYLETENVFLNDEQSIPFAVKPGKYVKITVTDTGTGMDAKTKERIFDPFFTTKGMGRGTGLGLAMVYGIIKGHKGMIHVESEPGHGTTFHICLPASEKEAVKEKTAAGSIARGAETILLVDDEKMVREVSTLVLESLGYQVYAAGSGQEAVAVYMEKKDKIDLVILDMILPGISGGETFDRLREINPDAKVLLSSGYSIDGEAKTIMDRGCNGFIQKPFLLEKLSVKIREILD